MKSPEVDRDVLRILAGLVWTAVGLVLCSMAVYWLVAADADWFPPLATGLVVGAVVYYFGFRRLVKKNKARIYAQAPGKRKICLFAFQSWKSYVTIAVMITLGYTLRHLPVARVYLVPVYLAIGVGLVLASLHYYSSGQ